MYLSNPFVSLQTVNSQILLYLIIIKMGKPSVVQLSQLFNLWQTKVLSIRGGIPWGGRN